MDYIRTTEIKDILFAIQDVFPKDDGYLNIPKRIFGKGKLERNQQIKCFVSELKIERDDDYDSLCIISVIFELFELLDAECEVRYRWSVDYVIPNRAVYYVVIKRFIDKRDFRFIPVDIITTAIEYLRNRLEKKIEKLN